MNAFALPAERSDTATLLRELEQAAPNPVSKRIRAAMIQAAKELEDWAKLGETAACELEEAANVRISEMASTSRVNEIQRDVKLAILGVAERLRRK